MADLAKVFQEVRAIVLDAAGGADVAADLPGKLELRHSAERQGSGTGEVLAMVRQGKRAVSVHLMPIYCRPELKEAMPPDLARRLTGKSCFNFTSIEPAVADALSALVARCAKELQ